MNDYKDIQNELTEIDPSAPALERLNRALAIRAFAPGPPAPDYSTLQARIMPRLAAEQQILRGERSSEDLSRFDD